MRVNIPPLKTEEGFCGPCNKPRCEICKHITKTHHHLQNAYIPLDHRISIAQYTGSTEEFGADSIITDVCIRTF